MVYGADDRYYNNILVAYDGYKGVEQLAPLPLTAAAQRSTMAAPLLMKSTTRRSLPWGGRFGAVPAHRAASFARPGTPLSSAGAFDREV